MRIVVVRHGETALNRARVVQPADTPLSEHGVRQAARLSERLSGSRVAGLLCSDLPRAQMTAAPLADVCGLTPEPTPLLQERSFGDLRGTPYSELRQDIFARGYAPPGGETWEAFEARVARAWAHVVARARALAGEDPDAMLVVVTHGLVCRTLAGRHWRLATGVAVPDYWHNTGISVVGRAAPHAVELLNCAQHLGAGGQQGGLSGL